MLYLKLTTMSILEILFLLLLLLEYTTVPILGLTQLYNDNNNNN